MGARKPHSRHVRLARTRPRMPCDVGPRPADAETAEPGANERTVLRGAGKIQHQVKAQLKQVKMHSLLVHILKPGCRRWRTLAAVSADELDIERMSRGTVRASAIVACARRRPEDPSWHSSDSPPIRSSGRHRPTFLQVQALLKGDSAAIAGRLCRIVRSEVLISA